jgi:CrcB protein
MILLLVALGGGLGAVARYGLGGWIHDITGTGFPWGTAVINVSGSFAIGLIVQYLTGIAAPPEWRAFLAIGFLGGYTTFSSFSWETVMLLRDGQWQRASLYMTMSVFLSLIATIAGLSAASLILVKRG